MGSLSEAFKRVQYLAEHPHSREGSLILAVRDLKRDTMNVLSDCADRMTAQQQEIDRLKGLLKESMRQNVRCVK